MSPVALRITSLLLLCSLTQCTPDVLSPSEYVRYVRDPDNGFIERQGHPSGAYVEVLYQPPEYIAVTQQRGKSLVSTEIKNEIDQNSTFYHLFLSIGSDSGVPINDILKNAGGVNQSFADKKQQMLYGAQNSFSLLVGSDSIPCVFYHAQLSGNIDNAYHFVLAFEADSSSMIQNKNKDFTLVYNDSIWFQKRFDFTFDRTKIDQSPKLKI